MKCTCFPYQSENEFYPKCQVHTKDFKDLTFKGEYALS